MNKVLLNVISINQSLLNLVPPIVKKSKANSGGGGGDVPDVPDGYETFVAFDGPFLAADGEFYVKL